jgi:hypothetical protein
MKHRLLNSTVSIAQAIAPSEDREKLKACVQKRLGG